MTISQKLISGNFLALSRKNPELFAEATHFSLDNGTQVHVQAAGIISFEPSALGNKDIVLSCGVHGNETAPIEICDEFVQQILRQEITLAHRVLFLFGNLPAMDIAERFVEENMNRLFSGAHSAPPGLINAERHRAKQLEQAIESFYYAADVSDERHRIHYDLHTAIRESKNDKFAVYPFLHGKPYQAEQLSFLLACGINTILLSESTTTTFSYFSSHTFNADAFTVELGKVMPFGENDMRRFEQARLSLQNLICGKPLALKPFSQSDFHLFRVNQVINKNMPDFTLNFADDTPNFSDFEVGYVLASESGKEYVAEHQGEAIVFPNANVAIGQRALLTVVPTEIKNLV